MEAQTHLKSVPGFVRILVIGCALLPFLASWGVSSVGPTAQKIDQAENRPGLAFTQYMVNLGPVENKRYVYAQFSFSNISNVPVVVKELKASCSCLDPRLSKYTFEPGESGRFQLRVDTPNEQPGPKEYFVRMKYEDPHPREVVLTFKVVLPKSQLVVQPKSMIFYQGGTGSITREIVITDRQKTGMHLTGVRCSSEIVSVELGKVDIDEEGNPRMRVYVTLPEEAPADSLRAVVTISTDNPQYGTLRVRVFIQGTQEMPRRTATGTSAAGSERLFK
ncbi:MAG: DUF1573 domain-containing protein [Planctomycetes bacterium]|nr:DUF1573 domain-containing protein [Planctomycetota bacterium]